MTERGVFRSTWEHRLGKTESPIEASFLEAFCPLAIEYGYGIARRAATANETIVVKPQAWLGPYRIDFLIHYPFFGAEITIAVECDGHDFHERTKQQAARDRRRDREIQQLGARIFRFTGSEIYGAPGHCAFDVLDAIMQFQTATIVAAMAASDQRMEAAE